MPGPARTRKPSSALRKQPPSDQRGREMVKLPRPTPRVPKPMPPKRTPQAMKASDELSRSLMGLLEESQRKQAAPLGMVKCPVCGTPVEPTRNQRIRTHDNALLVQRCPASGQRWELFGAPPALAKAVPPKPKKNPARKDQRRKAATR